MNLGVITFLAPDGSHGYLFKLVRLEERSVYDVIKRGSRNESFKFELKGQDLGLQKFQIVNFSETERNTKTGTTIVKIDSSFFRAVFKKENAIFKIIIVEFDNEIYILQTSDNQFANSETGVVMFQLIANFSRNSVEFNFDKITTQPKGTGINGFWINKFIKLSGSYNDQNSSLFDPILESIIRHLQSQSQDKFDLNKLLSRTVLKIKSNCKEHEYNSLTYFISCWQEKYPDFFLYSELSKILNPDIQLKIEFWVLDLYLFEELFTEINPITDEVIEYATNQDEEWQQDFFLKLKGVIL